MYQLNKSLLIVMSISLLFSASKYEYVVKDEDTDNFYHSEMTWKDFTESSTNKYICGYYENTFKTAFKSIVDRDDDNSDSDRQVFVVKDTGQSLYITEDNFQEFRIIFNKNKALKFTNDLPVKFFKVRTQTKTNDITFYDSPENPKEIENINYNDYIYYAYNLHEQDDGDRYVLLGAIPRLSTQKRINQKLLGWVHYWVADEDQYENAILWTTNIGLRPTKDSSTNKKPIVFRKNKEAYKASRKYFRNDEYPDEDILLVTEAGISIYNNNFLNSDGDVWRWLPSYMDEKLGSIHVGVIEDYEKVRDDWQSLQALDEIQIAFVVDATNSMSLVWDNLNKVLKKVTSDIIDGGLTNNLGSSITPKIQIWYYNQHGRHSGAYRLTNRWYSTTGDLAELGNTIDGLSTQMSDGPKPPMKKALEYALTDSDIRNNPTYFVVIGDAQDNEFNGAMSKSPTWDQYRDNNFFAMKGIRYKSDIVFLAEEQGTFGAYWEYVPIWKNFKDVNFPGSDFLTDIIPSNTGSYLPESEIARISSKISKSIIGDITVLMDVLRSRSQGKSVNLESLQSSSSLSRGYIEKVLLSKDLQSGTGTYFEQGILVTNDDDDDKTSLIEIDVYVEEEKLDDLLEIYDEYINDRDLETAEIALRSILKTFFELSYSQITDDFLRQNTLNDLWKKIVGNKSIGRKLVPELFSDDTDDFTFYEFLNNLEDHEEQFYKNIQESFKNIDYQVSNKMSQIFINIDNETTNTNTNQREFVYYWVPNNYFGVFKGISIE